MNFKKLQAMQAKLFAKKQHDDDEPYIKIRSNVIQFDEMGYPLRLVITRDNDQVWIDTNEREGDIVLEWEESE